LKLQDYNFTLWYIPGKTNTKADILSKRERVDIKEDNQDIQMLKEELWIQRTATQDRIPIDSKRRNMNIDQKNTNRRKQSNNRIREKDGQA